MLACSLVLALALAPTTPEAATAEPETHDELPHWRAVPDAPAEPQTRPPPRVPPDGSGMITMGSLLLGTGGALALTSVGLTLANEPRTRSSREMAAMFSAPALSAGAVVLTLGLVIRRKFRASEAASIPDAPRTGGGMLIGGLGLMAGGTVAAVQASIDLITVTCSGQGGCYDTRPIGAPIQLGCGLASVAVGAGLTIGGVKRRLGYRRWASERAKLQPTFGATPSSFALGLAGRF